MTHTQPIQCLNMKYCTVPLIYILNKYYTVPVNEYKPSTILYPVQYQSL